jgi:hypothetical protein
MRISVAALILCACGGAAPPPRIDACLAYQQSVRAPLGRLGRAADAFGEAVGRGPEAGAEASRTFAAAIDEERGRLAGVAPGRDDLAGAHGRMLSALEALAGAMRFVGDVVSRRDEPHRDEARRRLAAAENGWRDAVDGVKRVCPEAALPD